MSGSKEPPPFASQTQPPTEYKDGGLTAGRRARAEARVREDAFVKDLLGDTPFTFGEAVPWYEPTGERVIGAVLTVIPRDQLNTKVKDWPSFRFDPGPDGKMKRSKVRKSATNLSSIMAFVDLTTNDVVAVEPDVDASVELEPCWQRYEPRGD